MREIYRFSGSLRIFFDPQVQINVSKVVADEELPYMSFSLHAIGIDFQMRSLDMKAVVFLGGVELEHKQFKGVL